MSFYDTFKSIWVPIISAVISGSLTLLGVLITICWQSHKDRKANFDLIKPFLIIEPQVTNSNERKIAGFDDTAVVVQKNSKTSLYNWPILYLTNYANNTCILYYIVINDIRYDFIEMVPLKPFETASIRTCVHGILELEQLNDISIGVYDSALNLYEYKLFFEVKKSHTSISDNLSADKQNNIDLKYLDCKSEQLSKREQRKRNKTKV